MKDAAARVVPDNWDPNESLGKDLWFQFASFWCNQSAIWRHLCTGPIISGEYWQAISAVGADIRRWSLAAMTRHEFGEWGGVNASIEVSTTFTVLDPNNMKGLFSGELGPQTGCYLYGRSFNPTVKALGRLLAAMEGTESAYACASGMAAVSSTLLKLCDSGDHIVSARAGASSALLHYRDGLPQGLQQMHKRASQCTSRSP